MKNNNNILLISRLIVGIAFVFSGFVKAVDPMGTMIKVTDYFIAFHMEGFESIALILAFILCCYEFPLGVALLLGARGKLMAWLLLMTMIPFSLLTLYLAIENPVSDCGCFGDAIIMTNWQTFYKNVVLMIFTLIIFIKREQIKPLFKGFWDWGTLIISTLLIVAMSIYCFTYLPIIDFRPYKVGNDIKELMSIPEGERGDEYESVLIYENKETGEKKEFDMDNIPIDNSNWEWRETSNKLIRKGYPIKIKDFKLSDSMGNDISEIFLNETGYRLLIIHHKLSEHNQKAQRKLNELVNEVLKDGDIGVWAVTSSLDEEVKKYSHENNVPYVMSSTDIVLLETMIRSNPGLILFKDNVVVKKWPGRHIPDYKKINKLLYN
ncbi:MAG: DoxX family protein [Bacteroidetes bacterium]|nr:DoxX family protein [Bacteroidota bacterium]